MSTQHDLFVHVLDAIPLPIRLFDLGARAVHDTPPLRAALRGGDMTKLTDALAELARQIAADTPRPSVRCHVRIDSFEYDLSGFPVAAVVAGYESIVVAFQRSERTTLSDSQLRDRFRLTPREIDVLRLLAIGLPNGEIAAKLARSHYTVRRHTERIFAKLEVRHRAQVVTRLVEM
ncbi:MAG TPA: helix-turn-helix transcriptional regulator [Gemmatimonadaceae bacterium]|jgi:DNA-binding CsgD family transcriptional regulator|nr:helix-turn-helix transcriptional regulator [Gemmatimonadaceae bacterium]